MNEYEMKHGKGTVFDWKGECFRLEACDSTAWESTVNRCDSLFETIYGDEIKALVDKYGYEYVNSEFEKWKGNKDDTDRED